MSEYKNGSLVGGGGGDGETISCIWGRPANPHAYDDEFDSGTLDAAWSWTTNGDACAIDATPIDVYNTYSGPAVNKTRYEVNTAQQPSWLRIQPYQDQVAGNENVYMEKAITAPTNFLMYSRLRFQQDLSIASNEIMVGLIVFLGAYNNWYHIQLQETDVGIVRSDAYVYAAGSGTLVGTTASVSTQGQALQYVALQKLDTTYHFWVGTESNWIHMGSSSAATGAVTKIGISANSSGGTKPWVVGCDFVRFIETDKFLIG